MVQIDLKSRYSLRKRCPNSNMNRDGITLSKKRLLLQHTKHDTFHFNLSFVFAIILFYSW